MQATPTIAIELPQLLYQRLQRLAELTRRPLEKLVVQTLEANVPSLPENLSPSIRQTLLDLELLDDDALWQVAYSTIAPTQHQKYSRLLEKNRLKTLSHTEQMTLERLYQEAQCHTIRKGYAFVLLKWRGYPVPTLAELELKAG